MQSDDLDGPITQHFLEVGKRFSRLMGWGSVERCNCMVRQSINGDSSPAIRKGKGKNAKFFTPEGYEIAPVVRFEEMSGAMIIKTMKARGEEYIGHIFGPFMPAPKAE